MTISPLNPRFRITNGAGLISPEFLRWIEQLRGFTSDTPTGTIHATLVTTEPFGWKFCAGQTLKRVDFQDLYRVIGTKFGGTAEIFNLPDLRGRVLMGQNGNLMQTGGSSEVTLSIDNLPPHDHGQHTHATGPGVWLTGEDSWTRDTTLTGAEQGGGTTGTTGGGQPVDITPAHVTVNWIIKT